MEGEGAGDEGSEIRVARCTNNLRLGTRATHRCGAMGSCMLVKHGACTCKVKVHVEGQGTTVA